MTRASKASQKETPEPPRDLLPIESSWLDIGKRPIRARKDGLDQEITIKEAVIQKQAETALKGSTHAQGQFLRAIQRAERIAAKKAEAEVAQGREFQANIRARFKEWVSAGNNPKLYTPHPDDIIVTPGVGWHINGPIDQSELDDLLKRCDERNVFFAQAMLDERLASKQEWQEAGDDTSAKPGSLAYFMVHMIDGELPKRFRLSTEDFYKLDLACRRMNKRELLKHMVAAWRQAGRPVPRGKRFPSLKSMMPRFYALAETTRLMLARDKAGKPMSLEEIAENLMAMAA